MLARVLASIVKLASMLSSTCQHCGAELLDGAKFCRRCGQPAGTEAETRILEAERGASTQYYDAKPTGLSYLSPSEMSPPPQQSFATQTLPHNGKKRRGVLLGSALVILALISLTVFAVWRLSGSSQKPPTEPKAPTAPVIVPPQPPQPPQPSQPPTTGKGSASALDYPGAKVTMEMTRGTEGSIRHLQTTDSFEKVVAWYTERLKPEENIKTKEGPTAILRGKEITAIITSEDEGTQILLQAGVDQ